jgi:hypothetical protein
MRSEGPDSGEEVGLGRHLNNAPPLMVMAEDMMETVKKRLQDGWIKVRMDIEVLAVTKEAAESSLHKHIELMKKENDFIIYRERFEDAEKAKAPLPNVKEAYSQVVETEAIARRFDTLAYLILNYAPSSVEILEPSKIQMDMGEAQGLLNSLAELVHSLVASRRGAVTIPT